VFAWLGTSPAFKSASRIQTRKAEQGIFKRVPQASTGEAGSVWDAAFARICCFGEKLDFGGRRVMSNPNEINVAEGDDFCNTGFRFTGRSIADAKQLKTEFLLASFF